VNFVKRTPLRVVFSTLFSVFVYPYETLSLVFDKLRQVQYQNALEYHVYHRCLRHILNYALFIRMAFATYQRFFLFYKGHSVVTELLKHPQLQRAGTSPSSPPLDRYSYARLINAGFR